jgi:hypothetical protein
MSLGLAALLLVPLLFALGVVMWSVWAARHHRQTTEGRDGHDVKDPEHSERPWPKDLIDDRLPDSKGHPHQR